VMPNGTGMHWTTGGDRHMLSYVTPRTRRTYTFWIEPAQADGLKALKERDGVPESESVRRAIDAWLRTKGIRTDKTRAATRKRS
jgi:hypothetical protein